jgi:hypothetical protein
MRFWVLTLVLSATNSSYGFTFTPSTQCVLCSTIIRCGPGVDAVIRLSNSGREMTVERYCSEQSNEQDSKYRELRNIFAKTRFTYAEYLQKVPVLNEKRIQVSPKPLISASDLTNTSRNSDLQNYTNYVLEAIDPAQDKDLEVKADGKLVSKLDRQSQKVKDDLKSRAPSSVDSPIKRNGAWVSPQQEPYIDPTEKSTTATPRRTAVPTSTPIEFRTLIDDSFRRTYCRGKSDRECNDIWNTVNKDKTVKADTKPLPKQNNNANDSVVKPMQPSSSSASAFSQPSPSTINATTNTDSSARLPSSTNTLSNSNSPIAKTPKLEATIKKTPALSSPKVNIADTRVSNLRQSIDFKAASKQTLTRMMALNTSPVFRKVDVVTPYGTLINVKLQPSGDIFESDRPICENLEDWRTTAFFTDALINIDPTNKLLTESSLGKDDILSPPKYCGSGKTEVKIICEFGAAQSACSCKDYSTQYLLKKCNDRFTLKPETADELTINSCKQQLAKIIKDEKVVDKFARPYAVSLAETYLCLNVPVSSRQTCNSKVDQTFAAMSEKECVSLHKALSPNAKDYIAQNKTELEKYDWFKLYQYHGKEFLSMFGEYDLKIKPKALRKGACKQQIRSVLEDITKQLEEGHQEVLAGVKRTDFAKDILDLCKQSDCKPSFSEELSKILTPAKTDRITDQKMAQEMKDLAMLYRDVTVYDNLNNSHCPMVSPAPTLPPPAIQIGPQNNFQMSPANQ